MDDTEDTEEFISNGISAGIDGCKVSITFRAASPVGAMEIYDHILGQLRMGHLDLRLERISGGPPQ